MRIKVFTLFPDMLRPMLDASILGRAIRAGRLTVELIDIRDYTLDKHRSTDDYPFGGGAGMVMTAQPIVDAIAAHAGEDFSGPRIYLSPRGRTLTQRVVEALAQEDEIALLCGHYEGVDQRALDAVIDEELSIGDYVLTGGELGALVIVDAVARLLPGVLGSDESSADESFSTGLLEYPQYTRPADFRGAQVPEVLLGGNHADIEAWRREKALEITLKRRPELIETAPLTDADCDMIARLQRAFELDARLETAGARFERLDFLCADRWPRAWFEAFVPLDQRRAAKKACFSGRRHTGSLAQAFAQGFVKGTEGDGAWDAWLADALQCALLYLPQARLMYRIWGTPDIAGMTQCILADAAMTRTFLRAGDRQWFARTPEGETEY